jgi:hypothetical protein
MKAKQLGHTVGSAGKLLTLRPGLTYAELANIPEFRMLEMMAMLGFSNKAIQKIFPLSNSQIWLRLRKANGGRGIRRKDYRDGENPVSRQVIAKLDNLAQRKLAAAVERYLLK